MKELPSSHPRHIVLVVDDEEDVRKTLGVLLAREGMDTLEADNGSQELALVNETLPCFALVDLAMPEMDGLTLCRRLRQNPRTASLPVILVTGKAKATDLKQALEAGVVDFVKKPFDLEEMRFRVRAQIHLHETLLDRKEAEEALRISEQHYRGSFDAALVGQALVGPDSRFIEVNGAFARMLGYQPDELRGKKFAEVTHPDDVAASQQVVGAPLPNESDSPQREKRYLRKDGSVVWGDASIAALPDSADGAIQFVIHVVDISKRKEVEAQLHAKEAERQKMELELRHSQKLEAVGQLAAGIAHEINTPTQYVSDSIYFIKEAFDGLWRLVPKYREAKAALAASTGQGALLAELGRVEDEIDLDYLLANVPGCFERCFDGVARITTIVRAMKEFAHPGQKDKRPADLNQAIKNTLTIARNEYKYVADVETALGEIPPVVCQLDDLNQVFLNLIVNAAHAISDVVGNSGAKGRIKVCTRSDGESVYVDIADTGGGIPEAIRERVFEPFFTTKPVGKGSGQGLAIARSIVVDKHGGSLTFESAAGVGTTFTMRLLIEGNATEQSEAT